MRGLIEKSLREVWLATLLFGAALLFFKTLLAWAVPQIQETVGAALLQFPLAKTMLSALLGVDLEDEISAQLFQSFVWVHPVVLALLWGHEIVFCTRVPAAEIDRGTVDVLLGLPVSRRAVYVVETGVWIASGLFIVVMGWIGFWIGAHGMAPADRPPVGRVALVLLNLLAVYAAVGGVSFLVSACSDRRGRAVGIVFALLITSFLLNFLAQFWAPADRLSFLSLLEYYRPALVFRTGALPAGDMAVLLGVGAVAWIAGGEILARRSICTV